MRHLLPALLLCLAAAGAFAQDGRRYAVLSLVGDQLTVVTREMSTGSRLDRNDRNVVQMETNDIDRAIVAAIDDSLRRAQPGAEPILLASRRANLYQAARDSAESGDISRVIEAVKPIVAKTPATHLVLVTQHRHRAMLRLRDGHVGSGFLEGVGFYVDHGTMMRGVDTNDAEAGFIAPYAYLTISVIDLRDGRIVGRERVIGSKAAVPTRERNVGHAWNRLTAQEKVARLTEVIREETGRAVPQVVAAR